MNKYNWKEEFDKAKDKNKVWEKMTEKIRVLPYDSFNEIHVPRNAFEITYKGNLDEYFENVGECDISSNILNVMSDMYKEIKKLSNK